MHHDAAREVEHAPALENSAAPNHVHEGEVNAGHGQPGYGGKRSGNIGVRKALAVTESTRI